ncbi:STAS domain-containing protein [Actinomycetes bacterium KLBMP 9759]
MERPSAVGVARDVVVALRSTAKAATASDIVFEGDRPTVRVVGRADRAVSAQVGGWLRGLIAAGARHLVVDLSCAIECDGRILTALARAHARLTGDGGSLVVVGLRLPAFIEVLPRASLEEVFIVYDVVRREARIPVAPVSTSRAVWVAWSSASPSVGRHRR